ncbi:MAG: SDR family oxidoreductase [Paludibacter sp.]|nr:SDR family oxidoreductase [Paludibacter sp.]
MKTALITGATSGIGLELALLFAKDSVNLLLISRNEIKLNEIKREFEQKYKIKVDFMALDLSVSENIEKINNYVNINNLQIDFLVNNAGFGDFGKFVNRDIKKFIEMISLNINALTELTHIFAKRMIVNQGGKILNVASIASLQPVPEMAVYGASKAFVLSLSQALNYELRKTNISVTALLPGPTDTNFFNRADRKNSRMTVMNMSPAKVAKIGYDAMQKGKSKVIAGGFNKLIGLISKIFPVNNFSLKITEKIAQEK